MWLDIYRKVAVDAKGFGFVNYATLRFFFVLDILFFYEKKKDGVYNFSLM